MSGDRPPVDALPGKLRSRPAGGGLGAVRSLGAVGRAALASAAAGGHEAQHRAYLQLLQERNQSYRQLQDEDQQRHTDRLRREQGFSVCFSGANARRTPGRQRDPSSGARFSSAGIADAGVSNSGAWRKWEERTVEIRGYDGEVYAVRPTGERLDVAVPQDVVPEEVDEALRATLRTTQQDLRSICQQLADLSLLDDSPRMQGIDANADGSGQESAFGATGNVPALESAVAGSAVGDPACTVEEVLRGPLRFVGLDEDIPAHSAPAVMSPSAAQLAARIARLPQGWRSALIKMLEEAEAEVGCEAVKGGLALRGGDSPTALSGRAAGADTVEATSE